MALKSKPYEISSYNLHSTLKKYDTQKWLLSHLGLPTRQNPRWPPFNLKIAKIAMKYVLTDLEWWLWSSNVGLLAQGLTSRQQKTCMSNI